MIWKKIATNPFQKISLSKVKIVTIFWDPAEIEKNRIKILENLDLENGDSKKNLFFLAWSHSAFSFSFFLVFKGAWKSRTHALQVFLDQLFGVFKAFFWSHAFSKKTKPVLPDLWIQENNGFSYVPNGITFHLRFCVAFKFNAFRFCFYWKAICEEL